MVDLSRMEYLIGKDALEKIRSKSVLVCGVGGVGSFVAEGLCRSGLGHITLLDFDKVEPSNLNRQLMTTKENIGEDKVLALKKRLEEVSDSKVDTIKTFIDENFRLDKDYDYVVDCIDTLTAKFALVKLCHKNKIPVISSLGSARRLKPENITLTTLDKTRNDPLAKAFRNLAKKEGYRKKIEVVFVDTPAVKTTVVKQGNTNKERYPLGSSVFTVGSVGLYIASIVYERLINQKEKNMKFNELKYERLQYEDLKKEFEALLTRLEAADTPEAFETVFDEINTFRGHISSMQTLCSIRHSIDTADEYYDKENEYWDETMPLLQVYEVKLAKLMLENKFRDQMDIPEAYYLTLENTLKSFSPEIIEDLQEENRLATEYGKLKSSAKIEFEGKIYNLASIAPLMNDDDRNTRKEAMKAYIRFFEENEEKFDGIYDKLVKVRDRMAKKLGYENFIPLGYIRMNRLDYDQAMVKNYRDQVIEDIVPLTVELRQKQAKRIGVDSLKCYDVGYNFKTGNPKPHGDLDELVNAALKMYTEMSEETGDFFKTMVEGQLFDLPTRPNKEMGGYCTGIYDYKVPFIFANANGTSGDVDVLTHEAGHAFQAYCTFKNVKIPDLSFPTMESAEIDSMSMEFFAHPWSHLFFKEEAEKYHYFHIADALKFLPYGCLVDHFQHEVYAHPEMTPEERKTCFRTLEKIYKPDSDYEGFGLLERGGYFYRQGHIFQSPFYYIDYTLAQVCALQFFVRMLNKDKDAWKDYVHICSLGGTKTFTQIVREAHLKVPFEDGCLKEVSARMKEELDKIDDSKF